MILVLSGVGEEGRQLSTGGGLVAAPRRPCEVPERGFGLQVKRLLLTAAPRWRRINSQPGLFLQITVVWSSGVLNTRVKSVCQIAFHFVLCSQNIGLQMERK